MSERPTLELSADQVRADGGAFLITMPPDVEVCESCNGSDIGRDGDVSSSCSSCHGGGVEVPPSVLVALNQPCPNCDGDVVGGPFDSCGGSGRLVFDLKTPCKHCHDNECRVCGKTTDYNCDGTVSYRVWLDPEWGILPITYEGEGDEWNTEGCGSPHVMIFTGMSAGVPTRHLIICDGSNDPDTVVTDDVGEAPPAARPGDYVARAVIFGGSHE